MVHQLPSWCDQCRLDWNFWPSLPYPLFQTDQKREPQISAKFGKLNDQQDVYLLVRQHIHFKLRLCLLLPRLQETANESHHYHGLQVDSIQRDRVRDNQMVRQEES